MTKVGILAISCGFYLSGCTPTTKPVRTLLLDYGDFGPQVIAHELLGMEWYQWDAHGDEDPAHSYNIKVVVYQGMPLESVRKRYPTIKDKIDYRYVERHEATRFLQKAIKNWRQMLVEEGSSAGEEKNLLRLQGTINRIEEVFGTQGCTGSPTLNGGNPGSS